MKKLIYGNLALVLLAAASSAFADSNQPWTGLYAGVNGGYGWGSQAVTETGSTMFGVFSLQSAINSGAIPASSARNPSGGIGGVEVSYDYQIRNKFLIGVAADYDWANIYASQTVISSVPPFLPFTTTTKQNLQSLATVRLILGLTPASYPLLAYLTGGYGYGKVETEGSVTNSSCALGAFCGSADASSSNSGWVAGGGLTYAFNTTWYARAEYLYYSLGRKSSTVIDPGLPGFYVTQNVNYHGNIIRLGLDYKFA